MNEQIKYIDIVLLKNALILCAYLIFKLVFNISLVCSDPKMKFSIPHQKNFVDGLIIQYPTMDPQIDDKIKESLYICW